MTSNLFLCCKVTVSSVCLQVLLITSVFNLLTTLVLNFALRPGNALRSYRHEDSALTTVAGGGGGGGEGGEGGGEGE